MPDLKLVLRTAVPPRVVDVGPIDVSDAAPRIRTAQQLMILPCTVPPREGDYVLWASKHGNPRLAIYGGSRNGLPRLRRWDDVPIGAIPVFMSKVLWFVIDEDEDEPITA